MEPIQANGINGQVTFDGQFVTLSRKGVMARMTIGKSEKRIPVSSINAVQWKPPSRLVRGFIQFTVSSGKEPRSRFGKQTVDASKDENSVVVGWTQIEEFTALRDTVEAAIAAPAAAVAGSMADELKKIAELRDSGVLSGEEFASEKAKLLD